ncbi:DmsE family decaheme c-type cytochrome [Shewanella cyperi]|uniref:DmsE family decaheme c-type cytochrome n=1 Tax=Shewanella cyperi TaxID=2814292 RepID=A0A974XLR4_9GAMM|nr:DmsE family decaheme c-type cytochrome [Shewanella cyperi]QSX29366.1 DmsE family decaheme c-type cytochrome [Shewanella cyperi]
MMKKLSLMAAVGWLLLAQPAFADDGPKYDPRGTKGCMKCHDVDAEKPIMAIQHTVHAVIADADSPFAKNNRGCESCHGPSAGHGANLQDDEVRPAPAVNFNTTLGLSPVKDREEACLNCHQKQGHVAQWQGSAHEQADVSCTSCHELHTQNDPMLDKKLQAEKCYSCHTNERIDSNRASHHPMKEGLVTCTDCHQVHGSNGPSLLTGFTVNETCYSCHAEKRGPFLWEHEPVTENCLNCHLAHGSNNMRLLKVRSPYLCQSCHMQKGGHDSALNLPGDSKFDQKGCVNCHSSVHGSNHPSGIKRHR